MRMIFRQLACTAFVLVAAAVAPLSARAALVSLSYSFTATNFFQAAPPFDPVTGSFSVAFDNNSGFIENETTGLTASISIPVEDVAGPDIGFFYHPFQDRLVIGGLINDVTGLSNEPDFWVVLLNVSTAPSFFDLFYTDGSGSFFSTETIRAQPFVVPEPDTIALLGAGLIALGWARRRTRAQ